jgi:glyoxylase-like metal-dependent hydrolase (beta-lactamase superfamily II)
VDIEELRPDLFRVPLRFGQVYLWRDGSDLTLVDAGVPGSAPDIAEAVSQLGLPRSAIRRIIVTHGHEDHYGSAAEVRSWHGAPVYAHAADAPVIRGEALRSEPALTTFDQPIWAQVQSLGVPNVIEPSDVDVEVTGDAELDFGGGAQLLSVPGHTAGSMALFLPRHRVVFTGDTWAAAETGEVIVGVFNVDEETMVASCRRIAELDVETACFGHGPPVVTGAGPAMRMAAARHVVRPLV